MKYGVARNFPARQGTQRGSALMLVLWCILILSVGILGVARLVDSGISHSRQSSRRFEAKQLALTGIAYGCDARIKKDDPLLMQKWESYAQLKVLIRSEGGRININRMLEREDYTILADLFKQWGVSDQDAALLTDCLKDWVDADDFRSLHGAEKRELEGTSYSIPENRPFLTVTEMAGIKNWKLIEELKPDWAESFSVLSADKLDLQEVSVDILMAFGQLTQHQAENFVIYRNGSDREPHTEDDIKMDDIKMSPEDQVGAIVGLSDHQREAVRQNFQVGGSPIRIVSTGTIGDTKYVITIVVAQRGKEFLWWEEK